MDTTRIPRDQWGHYLDVVSRLVQGQSATIEVLGSDLGAQVEGPEAMTGFEYEPRSDTLWLHAEGISHEVTRPRTLSAAHEGTRVRAVEIEGSDGTRFVIRFDRTMALPG